MSWCVCGRFSSNLIVPKQLHSGQGAPATQFVRQSRSRSVTSPPTCRRWSSSNWVQPRSVSIRSSMCLSNVEFPNNSHKISEILGNFFGNSRKFSECSAEFLKFWEILAKKLKEKHIMCSTMCSTMYYHDQTTGTRSHQGLIVKELEDSRIGFIPCRYYHANECEMGDMCQYIHSELPIGVDPYSCVVKIYIAQVDATVGVDRMTEFAQAFGQVLDVRALDSKFENGRRVFFVLMSNISAASAFVYHINQTIMGDRTPRAKIELCSAVLCDTVYTKSYPVSGGSGARLSEARRRPTDEAEGSVAVYEATALTTDQEAGQEAPVSVTPKVTKCPSLTNNVFSYGDDFPTLGNARTSTLASSDVGAELISIPSSIELMSDTSSSIDISSEQVHTPIVNLYQGSSLSHALTEMALHVTQMEQSICDLQLENKEMHMKLDNSSKETVTLKAEIEKYKRIGSMFTMIQMDELHISPEPAPEAFKTTLESTHDEAPKALESAHEKLLWKDVV